MEESEYEQEEEAEADGDAEAEAEAEEGYTGGAGAGAGIVLPGFCNTTSRTFPANPGQHQPYPGSRRLVNVDNPAAYCSTTLGRIENAARRQVTFCKRRTGLLKKAYEISVLCEAQVAVIIFSPSGKLSEFCSASSSMFQIIERYKRFYPAMNSERDLQHYVEYWRHEALRLQNEVDYFKALQSQMMGENCLPLSIDGIEKLESTLDSAQRKLRARKVELLRVEDQHSTQKVLLIECVH